MSFERNTFFRTAGNVRVKIISKVISEFLNNYFQDDHGTLVITDAVISGHKLRKFGLEISETYLITSGFDGSVILRNTDNLLKIERLFSAQHSQESGAKNSVISICDKMMVCLGKNGSLVGIELK